jgi:hypothetical protein
MFNVWINDGKTEMPKDDIFYIVSKEGLFLKKKMGIFESMTPVDKVSVLQPVESYASLDIKPIPGWQFAQILCFFRAVYEKFSSEAIVILHYNQKNGRYLIEVPTQQVSGAAADYETDKTHKCFERLGTIHSHANFSAFHSGVDDKDEFDWDGLHMTIGNVKSEYFSLSTSITAGGVRFKVPSVEYVESLKIKYYDIITKVEKPKVHNYEGMYAMYGGWYGLSMQDLADLDDIDDELKDKKEEDKKEEVEEIVTKKASGYYIDIAKKFMIFPKTWMRRVSKRTYSFHYYRGGTKYKQQGGTKYNNRMANWYNRYNNAIKKTEVENVNTFDQYQKMLAERRKNFCKNFDTDVAKVDEVTEEVENSVYGIPYDFEKQGFSGVGNSDDSNFELDSDAVADNIGVEFNPCENCAHRDEKSDLMLTDLLESFEEDELNALGFKSIDKEDGHDGYVGH